MRFTIYFIDLDATEDQLDFPVIYTNAKTGVAHRQIGDDSTKLLPLFEEIMASIPAPSGDPAGVLQIQVTNLDYSDFLGRLAIARVFQGTLKRGTEVAISKLNRHDQADENNEAVYFSRPGARRSRGSVARATSSQSRVWKESRSARASPISRIPRRSNRF